MKMKSLAVGLCTTALLLLGVALGVSRWALLYREPCAQPCRDLGHEPVAGLGPRATRSCVPKCAPLKLDLELSEPTTRTGKLYTLWYKITLTNVSCYDLSSINAEAFFSRIKNLSVDLRLEVRDPEGKEVVSADMPSVMARSEYGEVAPYSIEHGAFRRFRAIPDLSMDDDGFVTMKPGAALVTAPSIIDPRKDGPIYSKWDGEIHSSGRTVVPVDLKGIPAPPSGFRILDNYFFKKPGRYTIRAIYDHTYGSGITATPIYPYAGRVPEVLKKLLRLLRLIDERNQYRASSESAEYPVRVESPAVAFEVKP